MVITEVRERLAGRGMVWWVKALATKTDDLSLIPGSHCQVGWHRGELHHQQASVFARTLVYPPHLHYNFCKCKIRFPQRICGCVGSSFPFMVATPLKTVTFATEHLLQRSHQVLRSLLFQYQGLCRKGNQFSDKGECSGALSSKPLQYSCSRRNPISINLQRGSW